MVPSNSRPTEEDRRVENEMTHFMPLEEDYKPHDSPLEMAFFAIKGQFVQDLCVSFDCPFVKNALSFGVEDKECKGRESSK